ncbi:MAG TPA: DUF4258 domain-containing protein [Tepidisphaeraceae bacterium]|jgi:hypothetical protein|nr:DUF4258 domain-containing protein [Tepidisphaeraceae bacterium]
MEFRWNEWNLEHATKHGCKPDEIESVVRNANRGYPRRWRNSTWLVEGRGQGDRFVEVVCVLDPDNTIFVIHAMPLTTRRRRGRR